MQIHENALNVQLAIKDYRHARYNLKVDFDTEEISETFKCN